MDTIFLSIVTIAAVYYLYKQLFLSGGCDCECSSKENGCRLDK